MSWNNGYERRKFEQAQKAQAKEYRKYFASNQHALCAWIAKSQNILAEQFG